LLGAEVEGGRGGLAHVDGGEGGRFLGGEGAREGLRVRHEVGVGDLTLQILNLHIPLMHAHLKLILHIPILLIQTVQFILQILSILFLLNFSCIRPL